MLWDVDEHDPRHRDLVGQGWRVRAIKDFVEIDLTVACLPDVPARDHQVQHFDSCGIEEFARFMARCAVGDPFEETSLDDAVGELNDLITGLGDEFNPESWCVITDGVEPLGVVLPHVDKGGWKDGTLLYMGVLPEYRGHSWGLFIHLYGLHRLVEAGAKRYIGITDQRNVPMLRVFEKNGAKTTRTQTFYEL